MADDRKPGRFAHLAPYLPSDPNEASPSTGRGLFVLELTGDRMIDGDERIDVAELGRDALARGARLRERTRCAAIFADPAAVLNPAFAAHLAFGTDLTRGQAIKALRKGAGGSNLGRRMSVVPSAPPFTAPAAKPSERTAPPPFSPNGDIL